jgi:hypothetical protein
MDITFKRLTRAQAYQWSGYGSFSVASQYGVFIDGVHTATIVRESGGGFRDCVEWVARLHDKTIIGRSSTLKAVKQYIVKRQTKIS